MQSQANKTIQSFFSFASKKLNTSSVALVGTATTHRLFAGLPQEETFHENDFETTTISEILQSKGKKENGAWLWCSTDDTVFEAVKSMTNNNVGALLVMKSKDSGAIAGIVTERDYLRKIIVQGRSSKDTKVGDIMTEENKLITVSPSTTVLNAMKLMTENRIRHIPVCEGREMKGMVSIGDVVRAVVQDHKQEVDRLHGFIQGSY